MIEILKNWFPTLKDWLPILISILSIIVSIRINKKNNQQNSEYRNRTAELAVQKEQIRQQERKTDEIFMRLNSRSNLIPYFHLVLDNSKIEKISNNHSESIKLEIGLINIGIESASNIMIYPMGKGLANYFVTENEETNRYFIYDYLSQYFAFSRECIAFSITRDLPKDNEGRVLDSIRFKIRFRDLLGNLFEQEFRFGYDNYIVNGFSLNSFSSPPSLIEKQNIF